MKTTTSVAGSALRGDYQSMVRFLSRVLLRMHRSMRCTMLRILDMLRFATMRRRREKLAMYESVLALLDANTVVLADIPVLHTMREELFRYIATIEAGVAVQEHGRRCRAGRLIDAEEAAFDLLIPVCFALHCLARRSHNEELKQQTLLDEHQLRKYGVEGLLRTSRIITQEALAHEHDLEYYGICRAMVEDMRTRMERYAYLAGTSAIPLTEMRGSRHAIAACFDAADTLICEELDRIMELLRFTNPRLYNEYHSTRDRHETVRGMRSRTDPLPAPHPAAW